MKMDDMNRVLSPYSEAESYDWLNRLTVQHASVFGNELITMASIGPYMRLRRSLGITAGYNRNKRDSSLMASIDSKSVTCKVVKSLIANGYYLVSNNILKDAPQATRREISSTLSRPQEVNKRSVQVPVNFASLLKHILNPDLYKAIKLFLGVERPIFYPPHILRSNPVPRGKSQSDKELSDQAFSFHRDFDNIIWLKLFVNLTTTIGGHHEYIGGSHHESERSIGRDFSSRTQMLKLEDRFNAQTKYESHLWTGRFHEQSIKEVYGDDKLIMLDTHKGVCWLEDTYGLHRGNPPLEGQRAVAAFLIGQYPIRLSRS